MLPECADKAIVGEVEGYRMEWMGNYDIKGLAVLVRDGIDYEVPEWFNPENRYMLPVIVNKSLLVLASWPTITPIKKC